MKKSKIIASLIVLILFIMIYFQTINFLNPIKGTYIYEFDSNVTLEFKNGIYSFKGSGEHFDRLVKKYGNNMFYKLELIDNNYDVFYKPIEGTQSSHYYLTNPSNNDFPIIVSVYEKGELILHFHELSCSDVFYIKK